MTTAQTRARIKNATKSAQKNVLTLDRRYLSDLKNLYFNARDLIVSDIRAYAFGAESIRLDVLRQLLEQIDTRLAALNASRDELLGAGLREASGIGVGVWSTEINVGRLSVLSDDAVRFVVSFVADDGIQLSERLWRLNNSATELVNRAVTQAVVRGQGASEAASEFVERGRPVPQDLRINMAAAQVSSVSTAASSALIDADSAYANALRVFRTEINRAYGVAYRESAFEHPDVVGTRFLLSPRHPRVDVCDMHANVNRYGLGSGVYPRGKSPWPAHPDTLSFEEAVFNDEISAEDRGGKINRIDWLLGRSYNDQTAILNGRNKARLLRSGHLRENQILTTWEKLKPRFERAGVI